MHRHDCKMKTASVIEYLLSSAVWVVLEHSGGAALTGCPLRMLEGDMAGTMTGCGPPQTLPRLFSISIYKRTPMQPALSNQSVHSVMHFEIEFHRLKLFAATPAI